MELSVILYYVLMIIAGLSAIAIIFTRNVLYAALLLIVTLLAIAGLYILLFAEFIAVTQILIYAGGVLVIVLFGIMLSTRLEGKPLMTETNNKFMAGIIGIGVFSLVIYAMKNFVLVNVKNQSQVFDNPINEIGTLLMSDWLLPFEIAGILLLVVLVGATNMAKIIKEKI
jgi:NADH:ubiquinone oxidoreductase subunit 6 (subunit J)